MSFERVVDEINHYIQSKPWLDFEVMEYVGETLKIKGSLDTSAPHDVEIWFHDVFFSCLLTEWRTDTASPPLSIVGGEETRSISQKFQVEQGHLIFRFQPEYYPSSFGCFIAAKEIGYRIVG